MFEREAIYKIVTGVANENKPEPPAGLYEVPKDTWLKCQARRERYEADMEYRNRWLQEPWKLAQHARGYVDMSA
jgi:hypothetical protein